MKKWIWLFILIGVVSLGLLFYLESMQRNYPIAIDTADAFGDWEYQICVSGQHKLLSNEKYAVLVIDYLRGYEEEGKWVYLLGSDGGGTPVYGVLNTESNQVELYWEEPVEDAYLRGIEKMSAAGAATVHDSFEDFSKAAQEQLIILKETSPDALPKASIAVNP